MVSSLLRKHAIRACDERDDVASNPADVNGIIDTDLDMTMSFLRQYPKVYWIWNHRRWCLERIPHGPGPQEEPTFQGWKQAAWNKELFFVEKMLDADPRNCELRTPHLSRPLL